MSLVTTLMPKTRSITCYNGTIFNKRKYWAPSFKYVYGYWLIFVNTSKSRRALQSLLVSVGVIQWILGMRAECASNQSESGDKQYKHDEGIE